MKPYSREVKQFLIENAQGRRPAELASMVNERFGTDFTYMKMKVYLRNHKLRTGTPRGFGKKESTKLYPREVREYIRDNYIGCAGNEMAAKLNQIFGTAYSGEQIRTYYKNNRLNSGLTGCFLKGHTPGDPIQKGEHLSRETEFKKGSMPHNHLPVGTETVHTDGYLYRKIQEPNIWRSVHRLIWEEANGEVPADMVISFLDGDRSHVELNNLILVSRAQNAVMNQKSLRSEISDITKTGVLVADLYLKMGERKKEGVR